jgi:type I restriction enzyme S subunit
MNVELQQTEIGEFPSAWEIDRVDSAFDIQQGKQVSSRNRDGEHQRPFLRTKNVFWNRLELTDLDEMHFSEAEQARLELRANDLLVCEGGSIGRTALWNNEVEGCLYQNHLHRLRVKGQKAHPQFSVYWLWYAFDVAKLYFGRGNVTTIPNLSQSKLAELPMALPPLPEQKKIAHILSTVQRAIEAQERIIQTTTELKKALMHKLFTEGLRHEPQKQTEIGPIPESWEVVELGTFCRVQSGFAFRSQDYVKGDGGIPITKIGDIQDGGVFYTEKSSYVPDEFWDDRRLDQFKLHTGDVLIALTGATTGKSGVFQHNFRAFLNQRAGRFLPDDKGLKRCFLPCLVRQPYFQSEISSNILVAAQGNISPKRIEKIKVGLPKPSVQEEIASSLDALDRKVACSQTKRTALQDLFRTLLHELMTAKTRVHELEISA